MGRASSRSFRRLHHGRRQALRRPGGTAFGGGVLYNKPVYKKLGLKVPKTWAEFMANNDAIKKAGGIDPVEPTYGDTWTSQLPVLADYANVEAAVPDFAAQYTAGKAKYATTPAALAGFQHIQQLHEGGYFNKDFASAKFNDGLKRSRAARRRTTRRSERLRRVIERCRTGQDQRCRLLRLARPDAARTS